MAASIKDDDDGDEVAEINVTPFIDVMLVLLIVFMIAAPLSTVDIPINLPGSSAPASERPQEPIWLSLGLDRTLSLGNTAVAPENLAMALDEATNANRENPVFLRADKDIPYGELMTTLDLLRGAGYLKVALVGLEGVPTAPAQTDAQGIAP